MDIVNANKIEAGIQSLSHKLQIAFAASCCERLIPNYAAFSATEKWGDVQVLNDAINKIWSYVEDVNFSETDLKQTILLLEAVTPHSEEFNSVFVSLAIDAVATLFHGLHCVLKPSPANIISISRLSVESIETYLYSMNDPNLSVHSTENALDSWVQQAPLLASELNKQIQDLAFIKSWTGGNEELIQVLRQTSKNFGIQPFIRRIVK